MKTEPRLLPASIIVLALLNLVIYLITPGFFSYGIFRDELYYLACANRLDFGYVDHPPFSIYVLSVWKWLFGDSLLSIRLIPALVSSLTLFMIGLFTKRLGGGRAAVSIAILTYMLTPIFLGMNTIFSMNTFDFLFWIISAYLVLRIIQDENPKLWIWLGIVLGFGLLNKTSMLWLAAGILLAAIFTPLKKDMKTKYPYIAALIVIIIFSSFIIWNIAHNFAHLEFMRNAASRKYGGLSPISFLMDQLLILNPLTIFIWFPGIYFFFFNKEGKKFKAVIFIWATTFLILLINGHSKGEYIAAAYQILFAGGAVMIEKWSINRNWIKFTIAIPIIIIGLILSPLARPMLSIEQLLKYQNALGLEPPSNEGQELNRGIPQFYADMHGWEDLAKNVTNIYKSLPEEEMKKTLVYCSNYGQAGAIEYFRKKYLLPKVICPHNSFWYWWPEPTNNYSTLIIIGGRIEDHLYLLKEVEPVGMHQSKYAMPYENNLTIFIGRSFKRSLGEIRSTDKFFI